MKTKTKLKVLFSQPRLILGTVIILLFTAIALAAPWIASPVHEDPYQLPQDGLGPMPVPPNAAHALGTLPGQYDVFYGLIWGTRMAFGVGFFITLGRVIIGVLVGVFAGYYTGWFGNLLMRITDAFMAFPIIAPAVVALTMFGTSYYLYQEGVYRFIGSNVLQLIVMVVLILFGWMQYARLVRGNILRERDKEYVQAAIALGVPHRRIMFQHIFPNAIQGLFVLIASDIGASVVLMSAFYFLGLTVNRNGVPTADWGQMLSIGRNWIIGRPGHPFGYWHTYLPPGLALLLFSMGWNLIGDGLHVALHPRLRHRNGW